LREIGRVRLGNPNDTRILPVTRKMTTFHDGVNGSLYSRKLFFLRVASPDLAQVSAYPARCGVPVNVFRRGELDVASGGSGED
jgi:hypothetical protein